MHPRASVVALLATEVSTIYGAHALLLALHADVPAAFAVAFALSRTLRRARFPAELAGAAALARMFPALREVKVTALLNGIPRWPPWKSEAPTSDAPTSKSSIEGEAPKSNLSKASTGDASASRLSKEGDASTGDASASRLSKQGEAFTGEASSTSPPDSPSAPVDARIDAGAGAPGDPSLNTSRPLRWMQQAGTVARTTADRYGAAYFLSARYLGVGIVLGLYGAVATGIDVAPYLERIGASPALGTALGTWAAAVTLSSAVYPLSVLAAASIAPPIGRTASAILKRMRM